MMITMTMNVIDSIESTDTLTVINNEQSIIVNCHCVFSEICHILY